ncbi:MAG: glutathione synthase [Ferrovum sp.]|nr:glutathione synthase [Ferrovum sp.]NDU87434.1 glutathione synthase [Ferrovum sp.]
MELAFIIDPLDSLKPAKDSTLELMRVASQRNHRLFVLEVTDLFLKQGQVWASVTPLPYLGDSITPWAHCGTPEQRPLTEFTATVMRKDPPFDMEYVFVTYLLELAESHGARIFNRPGALRDHNEKLATARFPHLAPPTVVARQQHIFREFLASEKDIILKPLDGMGGREIFRITEHDPNLSVILETLTHQETRTIMAQRYLPAILEGDKRILMVNGEAMPYCLARLPAAGETRGNLAAGGTGRAQPLSAQDQVIAAQVGPFLRQEGVLLAGLDVIGTHLTEINITSPTCLREIRDQTGFDIAAKVVDALESACSQS